MTPNPANDAIMNLHTAYVEATGFDLPISFLWQRMWYEADKMGVTPECVRLVAKERQKRIRDGVRNKECLMIRNFVGCDERIGDVLNEAAEIRSRLRIKTIPIGKAEVLRATGRDASAPTSEAKHIANCEVIRAIKTAAGFYL